MKIIFGTKQNDEELIWQPNDTNLIMHTNTGIIGTMGTGKTQFTKSLITQVYRESTNNIGGQPVGILIFDYKGDYNAQKTDFIEATNANVYSLFHLPYNPLSIIVGNCPKPMLPLHIANSFKETLSKAYGLGVKQETLLREVIMEAYAQKGINKVDPSTWTNAAPTFHDVYNIYITREDVKEDSLYAAMKAIEDFEIFEPDVSKTKSLYDLIDGVTVIDLSGYDAQIQNLIVAITLDLFYMQMQTSGHSYIDGNYRQLNKIVLVDEADNFLSQDFLSIKKIMKEGREFGVGTILSTQLLSHFSNDSGDFANYIFTWVVHNVADLSAKDVKKIFNTQTKADEDRIYRDIKNLQKHHSLVKFTSVSNPEYITDLQFYKLIK
ncbi:MAG: ATP-binding protein [Lachnospiraceae bacterium]|nr:ATP-binding protein [Lachnospiraceae bacterium]